MRSRYSATVISERERERRRGERGEREEGEKEGRKERRWGEGGKRKGRKRHLQQNDKHYVGWIRQILWVLASV